MLCYTVSDINKFIKQIFSYEELFYNISVKGEISNFVYHKSGHMYFTLKDDRSSIKCVMFSEQAARIKFVPQDGMNVVVRGNIGIYEKDGIYQIYVVSMIENGFGSIKKKLDDLTLRLMDEGLFDSDKKKTIPKMPKTIGVITAPDGAALQDIIQVLSRRMPILKLKIYPALVQGKEAERSIVDALKLVAADRPDVLIIGRGGGSAEDLIVFNSEIVVRKVYELDIPIISAIGHETDRCLLDLVADLRAPTPSAAAELACVDVREIKNYLDEIMKRIEVRMQSVIDRYYNEIFRLKTKLNYMSLQPQLTRLHERLDQTFKDLEFSIFNFIEKNDYKLVKKKILLDSLNPLRVLERGYAMVIDDNNNIVNSADKLLVGDVFRVRFVDGECRFKFVGRS